MEITAPGGPEVLRAAQVPDPEPGPGEVVIAVAATAVNRADLLQRQGRYDPPPGASPYPGLECSGTVAQLGSGVSTVAVGDRVCALLAGGGYAERVAVPAGQLLPLPEGIDVITAGGLPEAACTVWAMVFDLGRLQPGETLLVHGGTSGIGTLAIQLAHAYGARVLTTVGSERKQQVALSLGADVAINYRTEDFGERVRQSTAGRGVDVVLDNIGGPYLARNIGALATGGRLVTIGLQGGRTGELDLGMLLAKRGSVSAAGLRARPPEAKAAIVAATRQFVWPYLESGRVRVVVDRRLPLVEAPQAHSYLDSGEHIGKVILTV